MQIVIDIPEEIYEASQILDVKHEDTIQIPLEAIANGTPIPKGHGGLVDRKMVHKAVMDELWGTGNARQTLLVVDSEFYVETIIPAERIKNDK